MEPVGRESHPGQRRLGDQQGAPRSRSRHGHPNLPPTISQRHSCHQTCYLPSPASPGLCRGCRTATSETPACVCATPRLPGTNAPGRRPPGTDKIICDEHTANTRPLPAPTTALLSRLSSPRRPCLGRAHVPKGWPGVPLSSNPSSFPPLGSSGTLRVGTDRF